MEYNNGFIAINEKHTKLLTALRTAVEKVKAAWIKRPPVMTICLTPFAKGLFLGIVALVNIRLIMVLLDSN
jgi:hypothetical protein